MIWLLILAVLLVLALDGYLLGWMITKPLFYAACVVFLALGVVACTSDGHL